jgi:hypothetical protein
MARFRYHRHPPPPPPPAPAPPSRLPAAFDLAVEIALIAACVVGLITAARWFDGLARPPSGWVCWQVARVTAEATQRDHRCEPAEGWHVENWPGVGKVAVPDNATVERRHFVRD